MRSRTHRHCSVANSRNNSFARFAQSSERPTRCTKDVNFKETRRTKETRTPSHCFETVCRDGMRCGP